MSARKSIPAGGALVKGARAAKPATPAKPAPPAGRGVKDISAERLGQLNAGAPATTLTECLAVDFAVLMQAVAPQLGSPLSAEAMALMQGAASTGISKRMALAARLLSEAFGPGCATALAAHPSDTVRGWACFVIGALPGLTPAERLATIRPLADDPHFGVREWAWLALRSALSVKRGPVRHHTGLAALDAGPVTACASLCQ